MELPEEILPTSTQLTNRRFYLKKEILKDLKEKTLGGFTNWIKKMNQKVKQCGLHDFVIISWKLTDIDFKLMFTTRALLLNAVLQSMNGQYLSIDSTHKLVNCDFKFTTFATVTESQKIADICYMLHFHEDSEAFVYGMKELQKTLKENFKFSWKPTV